MNTISPLAQEYGQDDLTCMIGLITAFLAGTTTLEFCSLSGLQKDEAKKLRSVTPWTRFDKGLVTTAFYNVIHAAHDHAALPREALPAELVAVAVCILVHPCNFHVAASWFTGHYLEHYVAEDQEELYSPLTSRQLYAMIVRMFRVGDKSFNAAKVSMYKLFDKIVTDKIGGVNA